MADYLPSRESELVTWSGVFDQNITAAPGDFGLDAAQAAAYNVLHTAWVSAYNTPNGSNSRLCASATGWPPAARSGQRAAVHVDCIREVDILLRQRIH